MERNGHLSTSEVVGVATATAAALGGIIVALGRAQQSDSRASFAAIDRHARDAVLPTAHAVAQRASGLVEQYPALRDSATDALHRAGSRVRPAADGVTEIATARAENVRSASIDAVEKLRETLIPVAASAIGSLAEQAAHVRERGESSGAGFVEASAHAADVAVTKTKTATGELLATIAWIVVAATLTYVVLLDEERRRKLRRFFGQSIEQIQLLRTDFAGYDDEM